MAILRIDAPLATSPAVFAAPVVNQLAALSIDTGKGSPVKGGSHIRFGSLFNIGGVMFVADADTAITGTASNYVKLTVTDDEAAASFVADLSGVAWNDAYKGYFDVDGSLYLFDEDYALADEQITGYARGFQIEHDNVNTEKYLHVYRTSPYSRYNRVRARVQKTISQGLAGWRNVIQFSFGLNAPFFYSIRGFDFTADTNSSRNFRIIDEGNNVLASFSISSPVYPTTLTEYEGHIDLPDVLYSTKTFYFQVENPNMSNIYGLRINYALCGNGYPSDRQFMFAMGGGATCSSSAV
jgi:hypothetical protein